MADETERYLAQQAMLDADRIQQIRSRFSGVSAMSCEECGAPIPAARRQAIQGVRTCVGCQEVQEIRERQYRRWQ